MKTQLFKRNSEIQVSLGRISYMNVAPVYYGLDHGLRPEWLKMVSHPPAVLNRMMAEGKLDISPVSSAAYARHQDQWQILPDLSISCFGEVMSVLLVSRYPLEQLGGKKVIMTHESATSAELLKLLCSIKNIRPVFSCGTVKDAGGLEEDTAGALVIGDAALTGQWESRFGHIYDLGQMWRDLTGLPFVFALWVVRKAFAESHPDAVASVVSLFSRSKNSGHLNIEPIAAAASEKLGMRLNRCRKYYDCLKYDLEPHRLKGLRTFFDGLFQQEISAEPIALNFFDSGRCFDAPAHAHVA